MRKILKIPVVGYILRVLVGIALLPKRFDAIFDIEEKIKNDLQQEKRQNEELSGQFKQQKEELSERISRQNEEILKLQKRVDALENDGRSYRDEIRGLKENGYNAGFERMLQDKDRLSQLNRQLSVSPTIWGDECRLHISPRASVDTCFFNVNSGDITIGDWTFAGSNVSILAGSHDIELEGFLRRDCEIKNGCDIIIGKGVWLASNSTILGPCRIGDNAVIAAGAVVLPGTEVPSNCIYGGIPAREIKKIEISDEKVRDKAEKKALERESGILFVAGWTEKKYREIDGKGVVGHCMVEIEAVMYVNKNYLSLLCESDSETCIKIKINGFVVTEKQLLIGKNVVELDEHIIRDEINVITLEKSDMENEIFITKLPEKIM